jgi:hypothetical protein
VETIAAPREDGSAPVSLNVDVPRYEHERPEEYHQARDRAGRPIDELFANEPWMHSRGYLSVRAKAYGFMTILCPNREFASDVDGDGAGWVAPRPANDYLPKMQKG